MQLDFGDQRSLNNCSEDEGRAIGHLMGNVGWNCYQWAVAKTARKFAWRFKICAALAGLSVFLNVVGFGLKLWRSHR
jgi:hypothetical protein